MMSPLPNLDINSSTAHVEPVRDWVLAQENVEDAARACETLKSLVQDAVYLDEDAYSGAANLAAYEERIRAQQLQAHNMSLEMEALRAEVVAKDMALTSANARYHEAASQLADKQQELENNAVVFRVHYQELIAKNEEIARLQALVQSHAQEQRFDPQQSRDQEQNCEPGQSHEQEQSHDREQSPEHGQTL